MCIGLYEGGRFIAPCFAALSPWSLLGIPVCPGTQYICTDIPSPVAWVMSVCAYCTRVFIILNFVGSCSLSIAAWLSANM